MFIGAPPAFVSPGRGRPGRVAIPSPFAPPSTGGRSSTRGCAREAQGRRGPAGVDDDHAPIPDNIEQILQVEDTNGLTKTRARAGGTAGHDPRLWSGGIARSPRARDITEEQAETILDKVLDSGINYIDTSIDYGLSKERIASIVRSKVLEACPHRADRLLYLGRRDTHSKMAAADSATGEAAAGVGFCTHRRLWRTRRGFQETR